MAMGHLLLVMSISAALTTTVAESSINNRTLYLQQQLTDPSVPTKFSSDQVSSTPCSCASNATDSFLANAHQMMNQIQNKTSMLSKIRHRATHSNEALWASFTLSILMVLLVVGVLHSKMWNDRTYISYPESQPVKFEQFNPKSEILVKDLIRSRGRNLLKLFNKRKKCSSMLQMETFLAKSEDTVDFRHKALLESSDEEFNVETESDSGEETVFKINSRSGQWEKLENGETEEMTMSLLGDRRRKKISNSSTESRMSSSMLNSSIVRDLVRLSDSDVEGEEVKQIVMVG